MCSCATGKGTIARELANKSREHDRLAAEARSRANETAYDGFNRNLLNRWKVCPSARLSRSRRGCPHAHLTWQSRMSSRKQFVVKSS